MVAPPTSPSQTTGSEWIEISQQDQDHPKHSKAPNKQGTLPPQKIQHTSHRLKLQDTFVGTSYFSNFVRLNVFFRYGSVLLDSFW